MSNTAQRIQLILAGWDGKTPIAGTINTGPISQGMATIAAEIDKMTAELLQKEQQLAAARAEVERLTPLAERWMAAVTVLNRLPFTERAGVYASIDSVRVSRAREAAKVAK